jgi:hypothetical protein
MRGRLLVHGTRSTGTIIIGEAIVKPRAHVRHAP